MSKFIFVLMLSTLVFSCQTNRNTYKEHGRVLASGQIFSKFLKQLSTETKTTTEALEKNIIEYIQARSVNNNHPNYMAVGLTEDQAMQIKSLKDDLPFMPKVRKWAMENINKVNPSIERQVAENVYQSIVVGERGLYNPYRVIGDGNLGSIRARQQKISPLKSLSEKQERLLKQIKQLDNRKVESVYRKNLAIMQERGKSSPGAFANGQEIVESAALITKKTGIKAMGEGCEAFTKNASLEVLEVKANVDLYRAQLIEEMAHNKAGRTFASVDDIPSSQRLKPEDVDNATVKAFQDVLGYTDDEARAALRRLKGKPCRIY